jgi:hypothetical protein
MKIFGFILNMFLKLVMGLLDKIKQQKGVQDTPTPVNTTPTLASDQLNAQELEFLLSMFKQSTFKGEMIEVMYNLVIKLQSQYTKQKPK